MLVAQTNNWEPLSGEREEGIQSQPLENENLFIQGPQTGRERVTSGIRCGGGGPEISMR